MSINSNMQFITRYKRFAAATLDRLYELHSMLYLAYELNHGQCASTTRDSKSLPIAI